jgi:hypothetical protein
MRSSTEILRASELNSFGYAWFYEVNNYLLLDGRRYLPDFWITEIPILEATEILKISPTKDQIKIFLKATPHCIEDTKGWWKETHPSYEKINTFIKENPNLSFSVRVEDRKKRWILWP